MKKEQCNANMALMPMGFVYHNCCSRHGKVSAFFLTFSACYQVVLNLHHQSNLYNPLANLFASPCANGFCGQVWYCIGPIICWPGWPGAIWTIPAWKGISSQHSLAAHIGCILWCFPGTWCSQMGHQRKVVAHSTQSWQPCQQMVSPAYCGLLP